MDGRQTLGEFFRFGVVGVGATALHYGIYHLLRQVVEVNLAYTAGYVVAFVANFYATSYFTFGKPPSWGRLSGMGVAHGVNYVFHIALLNAFLWLGVPKAWAPFPVFAIAVPVNFLLVRFVFKYKN